MSINLIYPVLIAREAGGSPVAVAQIVSLTALALGALLQALPRGLRLSLPAGADRREWDLRTARSEL